MRNLLFSFLLFLANYCCFAQGGMNYSSIFTDNFSSSTGWFYTNNCPGSMAISGGTLNFSLLEDGACDERMEKLLPVLPGVYEPTQTQTDQLWMMQFDFTPTAFSTFLAPTHMLMAVSQDVGTALPSAQHPVAFSGGTSNANIDAIAVYITNIGTASQADVRLGIFAKDGNTNTYSSQGAGNTTPYISLFPYYQPNGIQVSVNNTYNVTLVRRYATLILSVRQGNTLIGNRTMIIPAGVNIDNFDRLQSGNLPQGANTRWLSCSIDNLKFTRMLNNFVSGLGNTCLSYFTAGNLLNLTAPIDPTATYTWTGATQQVSPNQNIAKFPPNGGTYATGINYPISCAVTFSTTTQMQVINYGNISVMGGCKEGFWENNPTKAPFIYPNPAQNRIHIEGYSETVIRKVCLFEISGKKVFEQEVPVYNGLSMLDIENLSSGTYIIEVIDDEKNYLDKIIITK